MVCDDFQRCAYRTTTTGAEEGRVIREEETKKNVRFQILFKPNILQGLAFLHVEVQKIVFMVTNSLFWRKRKTIKIYRIQLHTFLKKRLIFRDRTKIELKTHHSVYSIVTSARRPCVSVSYIHKCTTTRYCT